MRNHNQSLLLKFINFIFKFTDTKFKDTKLFKNIIILKFTSNLPTLTLSPTLPLARLTHKAWVQAMLTI